MSIHSYEVANIRKLGKRGPRQGPCPLHDEAVASVIEYYVRYFGEVQGVEEEESGDGKGERGKAEERNISGADENAGALALNRKRGGGAPDAALKSSSLFVEDEEEEESTGMGSGDVHKEGQGAEKKKEKPMMVFDSSLFSMDADF